MSRQRDFRRDLASQGLRSAVLGYVALLIVLPLAGVVGEAFGDGWGGFWSSLQSPNALFSLKLTVGLALFTALVNSIMGTLTAFGLERFRLPGKGLLNALVDLPFAIPTAVSGLMLVILYGPKSPVGGWLHGHGIDIVYAAPGIVLAMAFVTFPFSIRSVQPLLSEMDKGMEEAAKTLGAAPWQVFSQVVFPHILPGVVSGFTLTFSRALAEFGSVVMVAGNIPLKTQVASVFVYGEVESSNMAGAAAVSVALLAVSFLLLLYQNLLLDRQRFAWWQGLQKILQGRKGEKAREAENWTI